jgi:Na+-transporting methylmalonyl-CoA/oxaloacetate decarboxylase gamma subunit
LPELWKVHLSQWSHAIEETSLQEAAITTAIGAGTAFALLTVLLIILIVMGFVAKRILRRQAELALAAADSLGHRRAMAAVIAVGVLTSGSEAAGDEIGDTAAPSTPGNREPENGEPKN